MHKKFSLSTTYPLNLSKRFPPTKVELHSQQAFSKNNSLKLYTKLPVLTQVAVIVWKSGYLSSNLDGTNSVNLAKALPCSKTTLTMLVNLPRMDFSALKLLPFDHNIYDSPKEENLFWQIK